MTQNISVCHMSHEIAKPGYVGAMSQPSYVAENVPTLPMFVVLN